MEGLEHGVEDDLVLLLGARDVKHEVADEFVDDEHIVVHDDLGCGGRGDTHTGKDQQLVCPSTPRHPGRAHRTPFQRGKAAAASAPSPLAFVLCVFAYTDFSWLACCGTVGLRCGERRTQGKQRRRMQEKLGCCGVLSHCRHSHSA